MTRSSGSLPSGAPRFHWIDLEEHAARLPAYVNILDAGERARARGYVFEEDRRRFVITRALLRITLADALRAAPTALRFGYAPQNKPFVAWPRAGRALHFSVSHAGGFALIATSWRRPVGVDVERLRTGIDYMQVAERMFSARERRALAAVEPEVRARAFFDTWTRKEAYVKAHGLGLSMPLDSFDVDLSPASLETLVATRPDPGEASRWSVRALAAPPGYAAAIACSTRMLAPAFG